MKQNDNITVFREYKKIFDAKTLLSKIIQLEFETFYGSECPDKNTDKNDNAVYNYPDKQFLNGVSKQ